MNDFPLIKACGDKKKKKRMHILENLPCNGKFIFAEQSAAIGMDECAYTSALLCMTSCLLRSPKGPSLKPRRDAMCITCANKPRFT